MDTNDSFDPIKHLYQNVHANKIVLDKLADHYQRNIQAITDLDQKIFEMRKELTVVESTNLEIKNKIQFLVELKTFKFNCVKEQLTILKTVLNIQHDRVEYIRNNLI